jgi:hypothetical protein
MAKVRKYKILKRAEGLYKEQIATANAEIV